MSNTTTTKHSDTCKMTFGRKDPACSRCRELLAGAKPRAWANTRKALDDARHLAEIRAHDCTRAGCGPVCTFGDW
jgi:peptidyl-tRNA hydrolase